MEGNESPVGTQIISLCVIRWVCKHWKSPGAELSEDDEDDDDDDVDAQSSAAGVLCSWDHLK